MAEKSNSPALTTLLRELARIRRRHDERKDNPELAEALEYMSDWQARRVGATYADLESSRRFAAAIRYFEDDLYRGADFAQRDVDLQRAVPHLRRIGPDNVVRTIAAAVELNSLSQSLDRAMIDVLWSRGRQFDVTDYCMAYRRMGRYNRRARQIRLIGDVGVAFDRLVDRPMLHGALLLLRAPAQVAGLGALHSFVARGFSAFARMRGAVEFLAIIESRETAIHDAIIAGSNAPFPDPLA